MTRTTWSKPETWALNRVGSGLKTINNKQTINMPLMNVINPAKEVITVTHTYTLQTINNTLFGIYFFIFYMIDQSLEISPLITSVYVQVVLLLIFSKI